MLSEGLSHKGNPFGPIARGASALALGQEPDEMPEDDVATDDAAGEAAIVVRTKRFPMKPMTVDDAILEMELLSHDFFLFPNIETGGHSVVYHRRDGNYGLIEPEQA